MRYGLSDLLNHECVRRFLELKGVSRLRRYQRLVIEEVLRALDSGGGVVVAELPTGYGKTIIPFTLAAYLVSEGVVGRVIHTYPATSMIEHLAKKEDSEVKALREAWREFFNLPKNMAGPLIGLRHMFRHESPLLTNPYVITTLDTLVAHYMKTAFAKAQKVVGRGMYSEFSAGITHTSLLVFDEAHMYPVISEEGVDVYYRFKSKGEKSGEVRPATYALGKAFNTMAYMMGRHAEAGGVSLIMTATVPRPMLEGIKEVLVRYGVAPRVITYNRDSDDQPSTDGSFLSYVKRRQYDLEIVPIGKNSEGGIANIMAKKVSELLKEHSRILCVLNTVGDAVHTYSLIKRSAEQDRKCRVVLMHSRYTKEDRWRMAEILRKLTDIKNGDGSNSHLVIVATQVVEASVDISVDALLTDAPPLDSLAQRVGRVCRAGHFSGECRGRVIVFRQESALGEKATRYGPYDSSLVKVSLEILDRLKQSGSKAFNEFTVTPREQISEAYSRAYSPILTPNNHLLDFLEQLTIRTSPALLEEWVYEEFGGFVRDEDLAVAVLVKNNVIKEYLATSSREANAYSRSLEKEVTDSVKSGNLVKTNAFVITPILEGIYDRGKGEIRVPVAWVGLRGVHLSTISWRRDSSVRRAGVPRALRNAIRRGAYLLLPSNAYDRELGLIPPALREALGGGGEG